ncbi:DNA polymerase III subunit gamma/tau, partial [bacterium]|nr:DNA polymerase III subunit gamma/tau [bacterium]
MLKTIENPPSFIIFIFATTEIHKIPLTIISRCQCLKFNRIPNEEIEKLLISICQKEKIKFDQKTIPTIAKMANGSARDSLTILDQIATYSNNDIKENDIYKIYGLLTNNEVINFINCFV